MTQPLTGIVVLDLTTGPAGALASMLLSDFGARVLRAVTPEAPLFRDEGFVIWDRGKEAIDLDITIPQGRVCLDRLIPGLDVLIEDQAPSSLLQSLFDATRLKALNPHLVSCSITAYGLRGPFRDEKPIDDLVLARTGMLGGLPGFHGSPVHLTHRIPSVAAAVAACAGIAASLYQREATGHGRRVETSLMGATLIFLPKVDGAGITPQRFQRHPSGSEPFFGVYRCADGRYINLGCIRADFVMACADLLGLKEFVNEPRFNKGRVGVGDGKDMSTETENELRAAIAAAFRTRSSEVWAEALSAADIPFAFVCDDEECLDDPQVSANRAVNTLSDPVFGDVVQFGLLSRFFETPGQLKGPRSAAVVPPPQLESVRMDNKNDSEGDALPLSGVRVLEITNIVAGPTGGRLLAELGADMIKLEPPSGDIARAMVRTYFYHLNSDKRGICIDPKKNGADEIIRRLVVSCDGVLANVRPGATERMGIGPNANPNLVESHITAFGWTGPYALRPGLDPMAQALTGHHSAQGGEGNPPSCLNLIGPTDYTCGIVGALNLAIGLFQKRRNGIAQKVETNLYNGGMLLNSAWCSRYDDKPKRPIADAGQHGLTAFHRLYKLTDGWIYVAADEAEERSRLLKWLGVAVLDTVGTGHPAQSPQAIAMAAAFASRNVLGSVAELMAVGVPVAEAPSGDSEKFLSNSQPIANDMVESQLHPQAGPLRMMRNFISFPGSVQHKLRPLPGLGEHTLEILGEIGYSEAEIYRLVADGAAILG
jgi:crotonobetainyl-CoA:carnitine CoA-transferase CaiB-like acyl-CoA transferase